MVFWISVVSIWAVAMTWSAHSYRVGLATSRRVYGGESSSVPMVVRRRSGWAIDGDKFAGSLKFVGDAVTIERLAGPCQEIDAQDLHIDPLFRSLFFSIRIGPTRRLVGWVVGEDRNRLAGLASNEAFG